MDLMSVWEIATQKLIQSIPTQKKIMFDSHTKNKSISIHTLEPSNFQLAHKNEVNFDPRTKTSQFDTHTKTKSVSIPHTKTEVI